MNPFSFKLFVNSTRLHGTAAAGFSHLAFNETLTFLTTFFRSLLQSNNIKFDRMLKLHARQGLQGYVDLLYSAYTKPLAYNTAAYTRKNTT